MARYKCKVLSPFIGPQNVMLSAGDITMLHPLAAEAKERTGHVEILTPPRAPRRSVPPPVAAPRVFALSGESKPERAAQARETADRPPPPVVDAGGDRAEALQVLREDSYHQARSLLAKYGIDSTGKKPEVMARLRRAIQDGVI